MTTRIAFLRGINVGGHGRLLMKDLRATLESLGLTHVRTHLQSGNVVFAGDGNNRDRLADDIAAAIHGQAGFTPDVLVLDRAELAAAIDANPFPAGRDDPKSLNLFFLKERPESPDLDALADLRTETERFELRGNVFYLHTPDGFASSRLATRVERALGVAATARNWRSVTAVMKLAQEPD